MGKKITSPISIDLITRAVTYPQSVLKSRGVFFREKVGKSRKIKQFLIKK